MQTRKRRQSGGVKMPPISTKKYKPLRSRVVGFKNLPTRRLGVPAKKGNQSDLVQEILGKNMLEYKSGSEAEKLAHFLVGIKALLKLYKRSATLSEKTQNDIFNFLVLLNGAIRERAAGIEPDLLVHFSEDSVKQIVSDTGSRKIEKNVEKCISFLEKLHRRASKAKEGADKKELLGLIGEFNEAIRLALKDEKELYGKVVAGVGAPSNNMEMNIGGRNSNANANLSDLLGAFKRLDF